MYERYFGLQRNPFGSSPDPEFLTATAHTREAMAGLEYGITERKGILVLTGEVGTGKTVMLRSVLAKFQGDSVHSAYVFNPRLEGLEFLEFVLWDFGLEPVARTKSAMLHQLNRWLLECYRERETCFIVIDEAQECSWELLEEVRLLTNLETSSEKLVQVILSGQPELETMLRMQNARQLRQRIALWCRTYPLSLEETVAYIQTRLRIAGTTELLFAEAAVRRVYELSSGLPRVINLICEHALILAYVHQERKVFAGIVDAVSSDLMLETADGPNETTGLKATSPPKS